MGTGTPKSKLRKSQTKTTDGRTHRSPFLVDLGFFGSLRTRCNLGESDALQGCAALLRNIRCRLRHPPPPPLHRLHVNPDASLFSTAPLSALCPVAPAHPYVDGATGQTRDRCARFDGHEPGCVDDHGLPLVVVPRPYRRTNQKWKSRINRVEPQKALRHRENSLPYHLLQKATRIRRGFTHRRERRILRLIFSNKDLTELTKLLI